MTAVWNAIFRVASRHATNQAVLHEQARQRDAVVEAARRLEWSSLEGRAVDYVIVEGKGWTRLLLALMQCDV